MAERTVQVTELILRDAHQSLMATRMSTEEMIPACEDLDNAGYWSIECWGGATFDACIRFLNEDPWERLRTFRKLMPKSRLQMLLRGQNILGYRLTTKTEWWSVLWRRRPRTAWTSSAFSTHLTTSAILERP